MSDLEYEALELVINLLFSACGLAVDPTASSGPQMAKRRIAASSPQLHERQRKRV